MLDNKQAPSKVNINESIHINSYKKEWPKMFLKEQEILKRELKKQVIQIEHIGSTSIPGMSAKPIIDIMIGVRKFPLKADFIAILEGLEYEYLGEAGVPGREAFRKREKQMFNLAVVLIDSELWINNLLIRDFLRLDKEYQHRYTKVKQDAINHGATNLLDYSDYKQSFMEEMLLTAKQNTDSNVHS